MFPTRWFPLRFFARRFWPRPGADITPAPDQVCFHDDVWTGPRFASAVATGPSLADGTTIGPSMAAVTIKEC